ncbi:MAG: VOC family protein [Nitrosopumilus sp.]|nr:VOC family protein [Nitrosopumilus sp.]
MILIPLKIDRVHLRVSNLQQSVNFYQSILRFRVLEKECNNKTVLLSPAANAANAVEDKSLPLLVLNEIKDKHDISNYSGIKKEAGLYHFAILLPDDEK